MGHRHKNGRKGRHHIQADRPKGLVQLGRAVKRAAKLEAAGQTNAPLTPPAETLSANVTAPAETTATA